MDKETIWKSRGTVGPDSTDAGTQMPLDVIDERLKDFRLFYHGKRPRTMLPRSRGYHYEHIVVEVTTLDEPLPHSYEPELRLQARLRQ